MSYARIAPASKPRAAEPGVKASGRIDDFRVDQRFLLDLWYYNGNGMFWTHVIAFFMLLALSIAYGVFYYSKAAASYPIVLAKANFMNTTAHGTNITFWATPPTYPLQLPVGLQAVIITALCVYFTSLFFHAVTEASHRVWGRNPEERIAFLNMDTFSMLAQSSPVGLVTYAVHNMLGVIEFFANLSAAMWGVQFLVCEWGLMYLVSFYMTTRANQAVLASAALAGDKEYTRANFLDHAPWWGLPIVLTMVYCYWTAFAMVMTAIGQPFFLIQSNNVTITQTQLGIIAAWLSFFCFRFAHTHWVVGTRMYDFYLNRPLPDKTDEMKDELISTHRRMRIMGCMPTLVFLVLFYVVAMGFGQEYMAGPYSVTL